MPTFFLPKYGYDSDFIANTQNLESTFVSLADTKFNANASVNSNGDMECTPIELTINAAASKSFLRNFSKWTIPRSSQINVIWGTSQNVNQQVDATSKQG